MKVLAAAIGAATLAAGEETVTFYVKQQGGAKLREQATLIADPLSERYGEFLSFEQVVDLQRPSKEHAQVVHQYLDSLGVTDRKVTAAGDKIVAKMPRAGLASVELPSEVAAALDGATSSLGPKLLAERPQRTPRGERVAMPADSALPTCLNAYSINAKCLRTLHGADQLPASSHPDNLQTVVVNQQFLPSDLSRYLAQQGLPDQKIEKLIDGTTGVRAQLEAALDTEFIVSFGTGTHTWWEYIDGHADNPFDSWLTYMSNASTIPLVHSLSVGAPENEVGNTLVARMNDEMAALGARGASIVFASGDSGYVQNQKFGAGSPWVTAVGGVWNGELGGDSYLSVDEISTGGFSTLSANAQGSYQKDAVDHYLTTTGTRPLVFDSSHRCVPDLSLFDNGVDVMVNGMSQYTGGTSAAAPALSGMFSLINDALLQAGHSPLGFANPLLYQNADAFQDITRGGNNGFAAVQGYDPASGLGTFDKTTLTKLKDAALAAKAAAASKRAARAASIMV
jgi:tripeptidyl-peptidase-1